MEKMTIATVGAGLVAAAALGIAGASFASAASTPTPSSTPSSASGHEPGQPPMANGAIDPTAPMRTDEHLLTGTVAEKVTAAARAKEPTASIQRVETDSDGVYEAHLLRADGTQVIVQVDASYAVTNVQVMGQGAPGGPMGRPGSGARGAGSQNL